MPIKELGFLSVQWAEWSIKVGQLSASVLLYSDNRNPVGDIFNTFLPLFSRNTSPVMLSSWKQSLVRSFFSISKLRKGQSSFKHLTIRQLWHCEENWADVQHCTWAPGLTYICLFLRRKARPTCDRFHRKLTVTDCVFVDAGVCVQCYFSSKTNSQKLKVDRSIELSVLSFQKLLVYNGIDT